MLETPVLFLVFNRMDMTKRVFARIREAQPSRLYVAADGPRLNRTGDAEACEIVREYVLSHIDWPCDVKTLFRENNLGCKIAVSSAITWFFENEEEGIILEDDCLPDLSFFRFCGELLERYRDEDRVMMISGNCHLPKGMPVDASFYFSRFAYIWGWATWRRAWARFELDPLARIDEREYPLLVPGYLSKRLQKWWLKILRSHPEQGSSWAVLWQIAIWKNQGSSINPAVNLVSHIDTKGTHMKPYDPLSGSPTYEINEIEVSDHLGNSNRLDMVTESRIRRSMGSNINLMVRYLFNIRSSNDLGFFNRLRLLMISLQKELSARLSRRCFAQRRD